MAAKPLSHQVPLRGSRADAWVDLLELLSGLLLVGFIVTHLFFDSLVIFGAKVFDAVSKGLDATGLTPLAVPGIMFLLLAHLVLAGRRIPNRFRDQQKAWRQARNLNQLDTWTWLFQVVSGMLILVMAFYHLALVSPELWAEKLTAAGAAHRVQSAWFYFYFYLLFIPLCVLHAVLGLYRQSVKWGWWPRQRYRKWLYSGALAFLAWSLISLAVLRWVIKAA